MSDEFLRIMRDDSASARSPADLPSKVRIDPEAFNEDAYLALHPDVAAAVQAGTFISGYNHYINYGYRERRALPNDAGEQRNRLILTGNVASVAPVGTVRHSCDALLTSSGGAVMIVGWVDDATDAVDCIRISGGNWRVSVDGSRLVRLRRQDVEGALGVGAAHLFGYFGFLFFNKPLPSSPVCSVEMCLQSGLNATVDMNARHVDDLEMRNVALSYLAAASFMGNPHIEGVACLDAGLGEQIVRFNRAITTRIVTAPYVERFGRKDRQPKTSLIVCLYGKAEFQFVQNCLYSGLPGIEDYEFIFVSNSPELAETLLQEAKSTTLAYGLDQTVVILSGNAGFGAANNAAVRASLASRVIALNPDVFPRDPDWARKHSDLVQVLPTQQTRMFGAPLYYDDGSLMHGGMYFERDTGISMASGKPKAVSMVRVEHYGKGAPHWTTHFNEPRPVPAVTGAFISVDRGWFERLEGFTESYVFGHYEDADLCLKSIDKGTPAWMHDLRMWHLEGKGSTRLPPHEGGSLVNRWLFSKTWLKTIESGLLGQAPAHPLISERRKPTTQPAPPPPSARAVKMPKPQPRH